MPSPILLDDPLSGDSVAIAHNGNVVNAAQVRAELTEAGEAFETLDRYRSAGQIPALRQGEGEVDEDDLWQARFTALMHRIEVAYSLVLLTAGAG